MADPSHPSSHCGAEPSNCVLYRELRFGGRGPCCCRCRMGRCICGTPRRSAAPTNLTYGVQTPTSILYKGGQVVKTVKGTADLDLEVRVFLKFVSRHDHKYLYFRISSLGRSERQPLVRSRWRCCLPLDRLQPTIYDKRDVEKSSRCANVPHVCAMPMDFIPQARSEPNEPELIGCRI